MSINNYSEEKIESLRDEAITKTEQFLSENGRTGANSNLYTTIKNIIFKDTQSSNLDVNGASKLKNLEQIKTAFKYIIEEIMELTPAEYDAIYNTAFNQRSVLDHIIRKIVATAPYEVIKETLFDKKKTLFRVCWPEYYKTTYKTPTVYDIFNATGDIKNALSHAGAIKDTENKTLKQQLNNGKFSTSKERKRNYNRGAEVDKILYDAMSQMLPLYEMTTPELYLCLAKPKEAGWSYFGFVKIIASRGCYPSPLDFYFWNSPQEYQWEHFEEYLEAREKAKLKKLPIIELFKKAYFIKKENEYEYIR